MTAYDPSLMRQAAQISENARCDLAMAKSPVEWSIALAARDAAKAAYDLHHERVYTPLAEQFELAFPRPSQYFEVTAQSGQTARYFVPANDLHQWDNHISPVFRAKAAVVRDAWLAYLKAQDESGYDAVNDEADRLCDVQCDREGELLLMPASHPSALLWKLERLFGPEVRKDDDFCDSWCAKWINAVMNDARRILASETERLTV